MSRSSGMAGASQCSAPVASLLTAGSARLACLTDYASNPPTLDGAFRSVIKGGFWWSQWPHLSIFSLKSSHLGKRHIEAYFPIVSRLVFFPQLEKSTVRYQEREAIVAGGALRTAHALLYASYYYVCS
jgi:hypothetical protein